MKKLSYYFYRGGLSIRGDLTFDSVGELLSSQQAPFPYWVEERADRQLEHLKRMTKLFIHATTGIDLEDNYMCGEDQKRVFEVNLSEVTNVDSMGLVSVRLFLNWLDEELPIRVKLVSIPETLTKLIKGYRLEGIFDKFSKENIDCKTRID